MYFNKLYMNFLIISDLNDVLISRKSHFSSDKGFHFGLGLVNNGMNVSYLTMGETGFINNMKLINYTEITDDNVELYDYIIFVKEKIIVDTLIKIDALKKMFFNKERKAKIIVKSDSAIWIRDKEIRRYISNVMNINASINSITKWINKNIDFICVQNEDLFIEAKNINILQSKLIITNMSVFDKQINYDELENPYTDDYLYCKMKTSELRNGDALYPLYYVKNPDKIYELTEKKRKKIIYMGRIKTDAGKIIYTIRDIIEQLGDDYELHIYPGSFYLYTPDGTRMNCSSNNGNHLEKLREYVFENNKNVFIHKPFNHENIHKYLWHVDCGIDFSPTRPENVKAKPANAKLLEYCYMGLPVVCDSNINNSYFVSRCNNGIVLEGNGTVEQFVDSIKQLTSKNISIDDKKRVSRIMIENENYTVRTKNFIQDLEKLIHNEK